MGESPKRHLDRLRLQRARELLRFTNEPVGRIAAQVGYGTIYHFSRAFRRDTGMAPTQWRTQAG